MDNFIVSTSKTPFLSTVRNTRGTSITELMVSVLVMGIAFAGICEAAWLNSAWANLTQHKLDNQFACKVFLSQLTGELLDAVSITEGTGSSLKFLTIDYRTGHVSTISYKVDLTTNTIRKSINNAPSQIVLSGVMGPVLSGTTDVSVFGFVDSSSPNGGMKLVPENQDSSKISPHTVLVIVDLDLASTNVAVNRGSFGGLSAFKSACSIHREIFLRNNSIHASQNY